MPSVAAIVCSGVGTGQRLEHAQSITRPVFSRVTFSAAAVVHSFSSLLKYLTASCSAFCSAYTKSSSSPSKHSMCGAENYSLDCKTAYQ
jgi:hypothetical protein